MIILKGFGINVTPKDRVVILLLELLQGPGIRFFPRLAKVHFLTIISLNRIIFFVIVLPSFFLLEGLLELEIDIGVLALRFKILDEALKEAEVQFLVFGELVLRSLALELLGLLIFGLGVAFLEEIYSGLEKNMLNPLPSISSGSFPSSIHSGTLLL